MDNFSRRTILQYLTSLPFFTFYANNAYSQEIEEEFEKKYPETIKVLQDAYLSEMIAYEHYVVFCNKAKEENFPNIAYLFIAFSVSEKIHAENYIDILTKHRINYVTPKIKIKVDKTKINLKTASDKELTKIEKTYPEFINKLKKESFADAVLRCMWSWKSHRQHENDIKQVVNYSGFFFSAVAGEIESRKLNFHVCKICGSTIDKAPEFPCEICNYPMINYMKIPRPV